jgi:leader peptidase (prepilin peptidase) / N-methyltransferase
MVGSFLNVVIHRLPLMMRREWRAQCAEELARAVAGAAGGPFQPGGAALALPAMRARYPRVENIPC